MTTIASISESDISSDSGLIRASRPKASAVRWAALGLLSLVVGAVAETAEEEVIQPPDAFLESVFTEEIPEPRVLWLTGEIKDEAAEIMGHPYPALRLRYWLHGGRSAWILEEIGKVRPITTGLAVGPEGLEQVRVLVYRESRGGEVRYPFFTDQFTGASLTDNNKLDRRIDGITGATLSVDALTRLSRLALYLHRQVTNGS